MKDPDFAASNPGSVTWLYAACTRARDQPLVTRVNPASEFLQALVVHHRRVDACGAEGRHAAARDVEDRVLEISRCHLTLRTAARG